MEEKKCRSKSFTNILGILSVIWMALLGINIVCLYHIILLPFSFVGLQGWIVIISLLFVILNYAKKRHLVLGTLCLLLCIISGFLYIWFYRYETIHNPFTSQQYGAVIVEYNMMDMEGYITYYQKKGPFLFHPQRTELGTISKNAHFVLIDKNSIYTNVTFMRNGMEFEERNESINLDSDRIEQWELCYGNSSSSERFVLEHAAPYRLTYYTNHDNKKEERSCILTKQQYRKLAEELAVLPLAENIEKSTALYEYELDVALSNDDGYYMAVVDGASAYARLKEYFQ